MGDLMRMFNPATVALIGASDRKDSIGTAILGNLLQTKYREIFAVNPNRETASGIMCHKTVADIGRHIDLAIIATPAETVPGIVEECGKAEVEGAIIISAGFRETGEKGRKLEERIREMRNKYGVRVLGPNSLGAIMPNIGLNATFLKTNPQPGSIAFISQSGALGEAIVDWGMSNHIGFSSFISLGSTVDVDSGDLIDFLQDDYHTKSIAIYMEHAGNAKKFISAAKTYARNKPIVVLKPGRFAESADALISHTGVGAGDDRVYDAVFRRAGLIRVKEIRDLFDATRVLLSRNQPKGPRLAIVTNSGSIGIIAADTLCELKGHLATLSPGSLKELRSVLPSHALPANPVDMLGDANMDRYINTLTVCLMDPGVDGVLVTYTPRAEVEPDELALAIGRLSVQTGKPIIAVWMGGQLSGRGREILTEQNIPVYETPEDAVRAYMYMYNYHRNMELLNETPEELPMNEGRLRNYLKAIVRNTIAEGARMMPVEEATGFLKDYGISVPRTSVAKNSDEAIRAAREIGYPVVLRSIARDDSSTKNVVTGLAADTDVRKAYNLLAQTARDSAPGGSGARMVVQKTLENIDHTFTLKARRDNGFGTVLFFGRLEKGLNAPTGFSVGLPPLNNTLARGLLEDAGVTTLLQADGERGESALRHLEEILVCFSNMVTDFPEIAVIDAHPIAVSNGRAYALSVRILLEKNTAPRTSRYPHLVISPYPTRYTIPWALRDGTRVTIRPVRTEDAPLVRQMMAELSEETLRVRFFVLSEVSSKMLMQICNVDYDKELTFVAETADGAKRIIGGARLIMDSDFANGQFALLLHDDFQGKGLGQKLLDIMIGVAEERGIKGIYGLVLTENEKMLRVCKKMGFKSTRLQDGLTRVRLRLN